MLTYAGRSKRPLHASGLLVPAICGGDLSYGEGMARGVLLGATTHGGAKPPRVPLRLRKTVPVPPDFQKPDSVARADSRFKGGRLRTVPPYNNREVQAALEFYALSGHMTNAGLGEQLRTGSLATKVHMTTAGVAEDVYKISQQL